jgi:hypothetical protein
MNGTKVSSPQKISTKRIENLKKEQEKNKSQHSLSANLRKTI